MKVIVHFGLFLMLFAKDFAFANPIFVSCHEDAEKYNSRSNELQKIVAADQSDRTDWEHKTPEEMLQVAVRDRQRRERIGSIFGEGCFKDAKDYAAAALVYQHGDRPDHYFQTFVWSKRGFELGDLKQKRMIALGVDRYLASIGHKQLFASQATKVEKCWCLHQIEDSFPETLRAEYNLNTKQQFQWLAGLNKNTDCPNSECKINLKPSPRGTVPGLW